MEKYTPHHPLGEVKRLIKAGAVEATVAAITGASALDMRHEDILATALALTREVFYKSMTFYTDHRSWQDVYHPETTVGKVYLKLTIKDGVVILSFKEL
jgi:motility quorum-sensing regulator/GCU-specific mRNA interferase toxin